MLGRANNYQPVITLSFSVISVASLFKFFLCDLLSKRSWW